MQLQDRRLFWWFLALSVWGVFTISLATWWYIFVLREIQRETVVTASSPAEFARKVTMIKYEGLALVTSLLVMVGATGTLIYRELKRARAIRRFFATFTHELKTPLASLRLQAESLAEDLAKDSRGSNKYLARLISDTERLELQLENSLLLSSLDSSNEVHLEHIELKDLISSIARELPEITILSELSSPTLFADRRALSTILRNIFHNAFVHGRATQVMVSCIESGARKDLTIRDNGSGHNLSRKELRRLGAIFYRPKGGSGNGIGLYLCRALMAKIGGDLSFIEDESPGFGIRLSFKGQDG
jgi:signal transduction histidine kinase